MKLSKTILFLFAVTLSAVEAQSLEGLWVVKNVQVGEESMTPIAKWFRLKADGVQESGNGWFMHSKGSWEYDEEKKAFSANDPLGLKDEYGAFTVERKGENMTWERMEDGIQVTVSLELAEELPKGPGEQLIGLWELISEGQDIFDEGSTVFLRWDKKFVEKSSQGTTIGFWHIHAHKPELTLIDQSIDRRRIFTIQEITDFSITLQEKKGVKDVSYKFERKSS